MRNNCLPGTKAGPADLQGSEEQAGTTVPSDSTTNRSDLSPWHLLPSLCTGPRKSTRNSVFKGDKPHTVLKHTQELVTSHESIGLSSETLKREEGRKEGL